MLPTPSRGGRLFIAACKCYCLNISTHALTWRATVKVFARLLVNIFLPTPSRGGRLEGPVGPQGEQDFYPRPHVEGDHPLSPPPLIFALFLPTPSHGGRPHTLFFRSWRRIYFYPRPHMEGDLVLGPTDSLQYIFLPTPSHGGRPRTSLPLIMPRIFLPTPSHGGRRGGLFGVCGG